MNRIIIILAIVVIALSILCLYLYTEMLDREKEIENLKRNIASLEKEIKELVSIKRMTSIPIYYGSTIYNYIDRNSTLGIINRLLAYTKIDNGTWIVTFGLSTCPHCKKLNELLRENYSAIYIALWLDLDENSYLIFSELVRVEVDNGIPMSIAGGVPHTLIIKNRSINAIVIGLVQSIDFWNSLIK